MDSGHLDGFQTAGHFQQLTQEEFSLGHHIPRREPETRNKLLNSKRTLLLARLGKRPAAQFNLQRRK
jgi:hypothetical protein